MPRQVTAYSTQQEETKVLNIRRSIATVISSLHAKKDYCRNRNEALVLFGSICRSNILNMLILAMAFGVFSGVTRGQVLYGGLTGTITDQSDAPVAGISVEITV